MVQNAHRRGPFLLVSMIANEVVLIQVASACADYWTHTPTGAQFPGAPAEFTALSLRRYTSFTFLSGRLRTGLPVAAKIAFITAGVTTQIVGSPTPPQKS
jgi:hypothetical protein